MTRVTFGRVAYVQGVGDSMMDLIETQMNHEMSGTGQCYVDWCEVVSYSEDWVDIDEPEDSDDRKLQAYIRKVEQSITGEISGVIFIN